MLQRTIPIGQVVVAGSLTFEPAGNAAWAATASGAVVTVRLFDQRVEQIGSGYVDPVAALPMVDGLSVVVAEADGGLWLARGDAANRSQARPLADVPEPWPPSGTRMRTCSSFSRVVRSLATTAPRFSAATSTAAT